MTRAFSFLAIIFGVGASCANAADTPTKSLADIKAAATPVVDAPTLITPKVIVGDPTSSLSHAKAIDLAQQLAARIPGAGVAYLDKSYTGKYSPAIPTHTVFVVEPVDYAAVRPFDLVLFNDPAGTLRCRMILTKGDDKAVVGFAFLDAETHAQIDPKACVGRIVASIHYDPSASDQ